MPHGKQERTRILAALSADTDIQHKVYDRLRARMRHAHTERRVAKTLGDEITETLAQSAWYQAYVDLVAFGLAHGPQQTKKNRKAVK